MHDKVTVRVGTDVYTAYFPRKLELTFYGIMPAFKPWTNGESRDIAILHICSLERANFSRNEVTKDTAKFAERVKMAVKQGDFQAVTAYSAKVKTERKFIRSMERIGVTLRAVWNGKTWEIQREYTGNDLSLQEYNGRYTGVYLVKKNGVTE